jgi:hypothetical protein
VPHPVTDSTDGQRPRLLVVDDLVLASPHDPYLSLRALATYSTCSVRWLRDRLLDVHHPLPCYRLPGRKVLVKRSDFDDWMARFRRVGRADVAAVVREVLTDLAR